MPVAITSLFLVPFEKVVNLALAQDPVSLERVRNLAGKSLRVQLTTIDLELLIELSNTGVQLSALSGQIPNATVTGRPGDLIRLLVRGTKDKALADRELRITGDVQFVEQVFRIISDMDINWQNRFSVLFGVPFTGQLESGVGAMGDWSRHFLHSAANNLEEYLHEEVRLAPGTPEVELFVQRLDNIRLQIDRLEARTYRVKQLLEGT